MHGMKCSLLFAMAVVYIGCAKPIILQIDVATPEAANLDLRLVDGLEAAKPDNCQTPCEIEIAPETTHELTVHSPGFYPARMEFSYEQVQRNAAAIGESEGSLMVPLQRRPVRTPTPAPSGAFGGN